MRGSFSDGLSGCNIGRSLENEDIQAETKLEDTGSLEVEMRNSVG